MAEPGPPGNPAILATQIQACEKRKEWRYRRTRAQTCVEPGNYPVRGTLRRLNSKLGAWIIYRDNTGLQRPPAPSVRTKGGLDKDSFGFRLNPVSSRLQPGQRTVSHHTQGSIEPWLYHHPQLPEHAHAVQAQTRGDMSSWVPIPRPLTLTEA